jgi:hypothetical protein
MLEIMYTDEFGLEVPMSSQGWMVPLLGVVSVLAVVVVVFLTRAWPRKPELSAEELAEMADAPMPKLQKGAWWGLVIAVVAFGVIAAILTTKGAITYWEDDDLRLLVLGIFLVGLLGSVGVTNLPLAQPEVRKQLDERDRAVLARAPTGQSTLMILGLAAWTVMLTQRFHDEGAIPVVYMYLIFGSVILLMMIGQSLGILLGYWFGGRDGEG